jgi:hypothetical protein
MRQQRGRTRKWLVSYEDGNDTLHTFSVAVPSTLMPGCKVEDTADTLPVGEIKNVYIDPGLVRAVLRRVHARKPIIFRTETPHETAVWMHILLGSRIEAPTKHRTRR